MSEESGEAQCFVHADGHIFDVEMVGPTPRDRRCECGSASWGEMDDLLTLTEMWEAS